MDEQGLVEKYKSPEYDARLKQPHKVEAYKEMAQSCVRVGQDSRGMGRVEDSSAKRKICENAMGRRDFVTLAMMKVKHSFVHRPKIGENIKPNKKEKSR